ncbi:hypothetical protein MBLL_03586 [Methylobacterium bullatum]|uniref:Abortive infection protein-like C-terminal domain-containing protein n=2 Tax=Methylobacterium bullatum TaxID=570505 RepID=A0A679JV72_9HYPH|nr:hypothetical protein MBLL_03586 [Methylobacterium bullatum]
MNKMRVSPQVIEGIVQIISGGSGFSDAPRIGIYRTGPEIDGFLQACGAEVVRDGSRLPTLRASLQRVLERPDAIQLLINIIEVASNPADFDDEAHHKRVVDYLNIRLIANGMVLRYFNGRMQCAPSNQSAQVTSDLAQRASVFKFDTVQADLDRALANAQNDPEDAVTSASSLLESMCRSILIEMQLPLPERRDLQSLYKAVREPLNLSADRDNLPAEISNDVRSILGGLNTIIQSVGALRTHAGDAHGRERGHAKIDGRIARLAIHTASAASLFLLETWEKRTGRALTVH